jgi:murein DD-endopeptidase MepM/ murein hydrolase activator NlpD
MNRFLVTLLACSIGVIAPGSALAHGVTSPAPTKQSLLRNIGDASAEEAVALRELSNIRAKRAAAQARLAEVDAQLAAAVEKRREVGARIDALTLEIKENRRALRGARDDLHRSAARMYRGGSGESGLAVLAGAANGFHDLVVGTKYLSASTNNSSKFIRIFNESRVALSEREADLAAERASVDAETQIVSALRVEQATAAASASEEERAEASSLAKIRSRKAEFTRQLAVLQAESDRISASLRGRNTGSRPGRMVRPADGAISSTFGTRVHPIFGDTRMHSGIDFASGMGSPVRAAASGVVVSASYQSGYGNTVVINHGGGVATLYAHLSSFNVRSGQTVTASMRIASVGSTGYSTGPHLHFEVRVNGAPVDPLGWL